MDRSAEWFVPRFGPARFRRAVGLLFLPYTGMVLAYTLIGSMLAEPIYWDRVGAVLLIYFLALGIGAHALDALGSRGIKPWGSAFSPRALRIAAWVSLLLAYAIGGYYIVLYVPLLSIIAVLEGFFLLAYNLEWFGGRFHTDGWFSLSWGVLPVWAGYILQTDRLSVAALIFGAAAGLLSHVEISASRPYKTLKRLPDATKDEIDRMRRYERMLKSLSLGTILLGLGMAVWRWEG
jgi:hypothetical protein